MSGEYKTECPRCAALLRFGTDAVAGPLRCGSCGHVFRVQQPVPQPVQTPAESPATPQAPYDWVMGLFLYIAGFVATAIVFGMAMELPGGRRMYEFLLLLMQVFVWLALLRLTSILGNRP